MPDSRSNHNYEPSATMELEGAGMLNDTYKCLIYGPNFKLLPHTLGRTRIGIQTLKLVLPAIRDVITKDERKFFSNAYSQMKELDSLQGIAEQEVYGIKVGLDVGNLRHQVERMHLQPKLRDDTVITTGCVLTVLILVMILAYFRKGIMLRIKQRINSCKKPVPAARTRPGIISGELLIGQDEAREKVEIKVPDANGSSPSVLYHKSMN